MADNNSEVIIEYPSFETADKGIWIQVFSIECLSESDIQYLTYRARL